ncbi:MAG: hypothetical protein U0572_03810 [Phycisphaerales bacterium]
MRIAHLVAVLVAVLVATVFFCSAPARAQGTSGQVPEPISTSDLQTLMRRYVRPTPAQWDAIESLHDDYRDAFRQLREGEIEKFLADMRALQSTGMPKREVVEDYLRKYDRLRHRIEELDGTLLDGVATIVGDEKKAGVARARDARARTRELTGGIAAGFGGGVLDLSDLAFDVFENPADLAPIDSALASYEQRLTVLARATGEDSRRMLLDLFKELEKLGLGDVQQDQLAGDPERMQQVMEAMQSAWKTVGAKVQKDAAEMRELNAKTFRGFSGQLQGDSARRFRLGYIGRAYAEVGMTAAQPERLFRAAMRMSKLDPDVKTRVKAEYESWVKADDALVDQAVKLSDEFAKSHGPMDFDPTTWQAHNEKLQEVRTKREELAQKAGESLRSILGDERFERLSNRAMAAAKPNVFDETGDPDGEQPGIGTHASPDEEMVARELGDGESPIGVPGVQSIAAALKLTEADKPTLETLHSDYLKKWDDAIKPIEAEMRKAQSETWVVDESQQSGRFDIAKQNEYFSKRKALIEKAGALDDEFFDDVVKALGDSHAEAIRLARLERISERFGQPGGGGWSMRMFGDLDAETVNLAKLLATSSLPEAERAKASAALAARADTLAKEIAAAYLAAIQAQNDLQVLSASFSERWTSANESDAAAASAAQLKFSTDMMRLQTKLSDASSARGKASTEAFAAVLESISESERPALQLEFDRAAFPSIFRDPRSALPFLEQAAAMRDLTDEQRTHLRALTSSYRAEYLEACRKMIPPKTTPDPNAKPEQSFMVAMEQNNARAKVQFDRDERSARAVSQLRRILTEEQQKRIPALAEYEKAARDGAELPLVVD